MAAVPKEVESKINRAPSKPKTSKPKSAGAIRMARLHRQKKELAEMAERYRAQFYSAACLKLAEETPKGSYLKSREFINAAWFQAGLLPPKVAKILARCLN